MIRVRIAADSLNTFNGKRLTTWLLTYPRFIHAEFMTHRQLSRNAASSRAIPTSKFRDLVITDAAEPVWWGASQKGMQASSQLEGFRLAVAKLAWGGAKVTALGWHYLFEKVGLHKQIANRILEPWMNITVLASATEWTNFFALRAHPDAHPEFQKLARMMAEEYENSAPNPVKPRDFHIPFDAPEVEDMDKRIKIAVGRCARLSYLTHEGKRDVQADLDLYERLVSARPPHMSPFEHVAQAMLNPTQSGNFVGWRQFRKQIPNECS